ncbi:glucuronate isomerase [Thalassotalea fonticola]|uniref:Uronate isomerase n=1 Tax=Thalassotalea fonticola TaxID=3065649 RepID=A0ABZ0GRZ2_9GAMM|nr:glucuronate isomerase [Colwelliaceae bacterium S1-1]
MMKTFIAKDFLLQSDTAEQLYFNYAANLPIIDYHNHLPAKDVANNRQFANISEAWLEDDHYKWRAMRAMGVNEKYCTGNAAAQDKFMQWANIVPYTMGNPLFHWTHMELQHPFGIEQMLTSQSAPEIYQQSNELLAQPSFSSRGLLKQRNVELICTTDDPADSLQHHQDFASQNHGSLTMLPTFRLDSLLATNNSAQFNSTLDRLSQSVGQAISTYQDFLLVVANRHQHFHDIGCRLSDVGLSHFQFSPGQPAMVEKAFSLIRSEQVLSAEQAIALSSDILIFVSQLNADKGWVQQLHIGALRDANSKKVLALGHGKGFDTIGGYNNTLALCNFLDHLTGQDKLAKTILYNLNPADNEIFSTMAGTFNEGDIKGKVQHGAAWWFLDQKEGLEQQFRSISSLGLLSCFVGMLTDSRSFLSFSRHEYFRRILCNFLAHDVEQGLLPKDIPLLGEIVSNISYHNAKHYFNF